MTVYQWLGTLATFLVVALLVAAGIVTWRRRRRLRPPRETGWLTDAMVDEIIRRGQLSGRFVPDEGLDLEEISREEERFWSESWDEPDPYFD